MRNVRYRDYKQEDLLALLAEAEPGEEYQDRHQRTAKARLGHGPAYTFICEHGDIVACAGVTIYWPGMGEVWLLLGKHAQAHLLDVVVCTGPMLDKLQDENHLVRIQADVVATNQKAINLVRHFGFMEEGLMKCYDVNGQDNLRFARIREVRNGQPG